jgi:RNA polymerase sigma factor (sigma-70 family)
MRLKENETQLNEQEIINNLKSSETATRRKAENHIFLKFSYFIHEATKKYGLSEDCVSDAYSDTVMAAIESIRGGSFKQSCSLKTFLFRIFHFKCVDILRRKMTRKNRVHQTVGIDVVQMHITDSSQSVLEQLITKSEQKVLKAQLTKLCHKSQKLLLLSVDGYSDKEIAKVMNFKTGRVVKTSRLRCIRKLREMHDFHISKIAG